MQKIFLIEDNPEIVRMYERTFRLSGFEIEIATDGKEALEKIARMDEKPSAVLLDLIIPSLSGIDVLRTIKADPALKHIPVLILTNSLAPADEGLLLSLGACRYLIKMDVDSKTVVEETRACIAAAAVT